MSNEASGRAWPFCTLPADRIVHSHPLALALRDGYPIFPGHTLVIPRRHVASLADLAPDEACALQSLLAEARAALDAEFHRDAYNVGVNDGPAAGQTVMHLHVHLIPRYHGDRPDPRSGVRWIIILAEAVDERALSSC